MEEKINLAEKLALVNEYWSPAIVGRLNDYKIQVVKVKGEFTWHMHAGTDEFFLVLDGELAIRLRDREVRLNAGEVFVVPRGVEHCPFAETDCQLLVIEPSGTVNTGEAGGDLTVRSARFRRHGPALRGMSPLSGLAHSGGTRLHRKMRYGAARLRGGPRWTRTTYLRVRSA